MKGTDRQRQINRWKERTTIWGSLCSCCSLRILTRLRICHLAVQRVISCHRYRTPYHA